jgi:hypothetical protein
MISILLNSTNQGFSFQNFYNKFIEICEEHRNENRALAFAFILYDFENPQIAKVLNDTDYWLSLNEVSGKYLTVFSLHYKPKVRYRRSFDRYGTNVMHHMTMGSTFNNPSEDTNLLIRNYFGEDIQVKYPSVIFFQIQNNQVVDYEMIQLDEKNIEGAFIELNYYIQEAVETLKQITEENYKNRKEIFDLVSSNVKSLRSSIVRKKFFKKVSSITELTSSIAGLGH